MNRAEIVKIIERTIIIRVLQSFQKNRPEQQAVFIFGKQRRSRVQQFGHKNTRDRISGTRSTERYEEKGTMNKKIISIFYIWCFNCHKATAHRK